MSELIWEEIHGFQSPGDFQRFEGCISEEVRKGNAKEVPADPKYHEGEIYGGRWYQKTDSSEVWRLVAPDFPFRGLWEPVDL
jgi:hypothetical protein